MGPYWAMLGHTGPYWKADVGAPPPVAVVSIEDPFDQGWKGLGGDWGHWEALGGGLGALESLGTILGGTGVTWGHTGPCWAILRGTGRGTGDHESIRGALGGGLGALGGDWEAPESHGTVLVHTGPYRSILEV